MTKYLSEDGTATSHYEYLLWCLSEGSDRIPGVGYLHIRDLIERERDRDVQYKIEKQS